MDTYDPKQLSAVWNAHLVQGWMDGTFLEVERDERSFALKTGAAGEVVRTRNNNIAGSVLITLLPNSVSNDFFSQQLIADELLGITVGALLVRDLRGRDLFGGDEAFLDGPPKVSYQVGDVVGRQWKIIIPRLKMFVGGYALL